MKMEAVRTAIGEKGSVMEAAIVEEVPGMKACFNNKRKTKAVPAAVVEEEGSMVEAKKRKDDPSTESQAVAADAVPVGGGLAQAENGMWIMPDKEVQLVLNLVIDDQLPLSLQKALWEHKKWVTKEFNANKGIVLLSDEMVARREANRKERAEAFAEMLRNLDLSGGEPKTSDRYSDFFGSDEEEEVEGEEVVQPEPIEAI